MCCVGRKSQSLSSSLLRVLLSIFQPTCNDLDLSNLSDLAILYWVRFSPHLRTHIRLTSLDSQLANPNGSYLGHLQIQIQIQSGRGQQHRASVDASQNVQCSPKLQTFMFFNIFKKFFREETLTTVFPNPRKFCSNWFSLYNLHTTRAQNNGVPIYLSDDVFAIWTRRPEIGGRYCIFARSPSVGFGRILHNLRRCSVVQIFLKPAQVAIRLFEVRFFWNICYKRPASCESSLSQFGCMRNDMVKFALKHSNFDVSRTWEIGVLAQTMRRTGRGAEPATFAEENDWTPGRGRGRRGKGKGETGIERVDKQWNYLSLEYAFCANF